MVAESAGKMVEVSLAPEEISAYKDLGVIYGMRKDYENALRVFKTASEVAPGDQQIQQNLDEVLAGKTAIVITHRIFALMRFDNIIVLEDGRIAEQGTHSALLKKGGVYADIYEKQLSEQKEKEEVITGLVQ